MDGADSGARKHGNRGLGNQRHVNQDTVSFFNTVPLEDIGELADLPMKLTIGQNLFFPGLSFPDDRRLVGARGVKMTVQTVVGGVGLPSDKPLGERHFPIKNLIPFFEPMKFPGLTGPELVRLADRLGIDLLVLRKTADAGFF